MSVWSDLPSDAAVSFTASNYGGFTLRPGQSNVVSDLAMSKADAIAKYYLDESYLTGYSSNQAFPKSAMVNGVPSYYAICSSCATSESGGGGSGSEGLCVAYLSAGAFYTTNSSGIIGLGDVLYAFNGSTYVQAGSLLAHSIGYVTYNESGNRIWIKYDTDGIVLEKFDCSTITYYNVTTNYGEESSSAGACALILDGSSLFTTNSNGILGVGDLVYIFDGTNYFLYIGSDFTFLTYDEGGNRIWIEVDQSTGQVLDKGLCGGGGLTNCQIEVSATIGNPAGGSCELYASADAIVTSDVTITVELVGNTSGAQEFHDVTIYAGNSTGYSNTGMSFSGADSSVSRGIVSQSPYSDSTYYYNAILI